MPRFFFNTANGHSLKDPEGTELADLETAKRAAVQFLAEWLHDNPDELWATENVRVTITDETGLSLFAIDVGAIVAPSAQRRRG